ncbi:MAG: hypothetical protein RLZZ399_858 [Verrucomicrobiota bacterium]|jgi:hypothetical protein
MSADANLILLAAGGMGYALLFWAVSLWKPGVALALVFGLAPFQNDLSGLGGVHFSVSELHLLLCVPLLLLRGLRVGWGWMGGTLWGGLLITVLLSLPSWRETSLLSLIQMALYWLVAVGVFANLPRSPGDWALAYKLLLGVGGMLALMALWTRSSYFWGLHKNGVGASLACALVLGVERWSCSPRGKRWRYLPILCLLGGALLMVLSRGAWLAALVGVGFLLLWRGQYGQLARFGLATVPVAALVWAVLPQESREYVSGFDPSRYNIRARMLNTEWAKEQWLSRPWIGVGVGLRKEYDATNVLWLTLAETGPLGLVAFLVVQGRLVGGVWSRRWSGSPFSPSASALALAGALVLGKFVHGMVDHYWSRGAIMIAWASVGMAISADRFQKAAQRGAVDTCRSVGRKHRWPGRSQTVPSL